MGEGFSLAGELELMLSGWTFISLDAKGNSGGCCWAGGLELFN